MTDLDIRNEPCDCPPAECKSHVDPPGSCVNRRTGDVRTMPCPVCMAGTWHQDGKCIRCGAQRQERPMSNKLYDDKAEKFYRDRLALRPGVSDPADRADIMGRLKIYADEHFYARPLMLDTMAEIERSHAEVARLREALHEIVGLDHHNHGPAGEAARIARAALSRPEDRT